MHKYIELTMLVAFATLFASAEHSNLLAYKKASPGILSCELKAQDNTDLSPYTGWTRDHWIEVVGKMAVGFVQHMDRESGLPTGIYDEMPGLPYVSSDRLHNRDEELRKAFERGMMIVAAYTAATGSSKYPGYPQDLVEPFIKTLIKATDPDNPQYWSNSGSHSTTGQAIVLSMLISPRFFWEPLSREQKMNLGKWLLLLTERKAWDNNHYYFHMTPVSFLDSLGIEYNREYLDECYRRMLGFYRADGWYVDGDNQGFDNYNGWGFHLYNMVLYYSDSRWRRKYGDLVVDHIKKYLSTWPLFFGADGSPIAWGRSLHYRFANLSPIAWAQICGVNPLDPGLSRRLASGVMKYFWENGCMSPNGLIEPGYLGRNYAQPESYGWRGQPTWSAVGLAILAIPEDDPFWTAKEKPLPVEINSGTEVLRGPQMVLKRHAETGECRLYKAGDQFDHFDKLQRNAKYFGHVYSSKLGFIVTGEGSPKLAANASAVSADGKKWSFRDNPIPLDFDDYEIVSRYDIKEKITGVEGTVITHTFIGEFGEVLVIYHTSQKPMYLKVGGHGIQVPHGDRASISESGDEIKVASSTMQSVIKILGGVKGTFAVNEVPPVEGYENSHLFGGTSAYPYWVSDKPVERCKVIALYINGSAGELADETACVNMPNNEQVELDFNGRLTYLTVDNNYWAPR